MLLMMVAVVVKLRAHHMIAARQKIICRVPHVVNWLRLRLRLRLRLWWSHTSGRNQ